MRHMSISYIIHKDMYRECTTGIRTCVGETEYIEIDVGLHQGSTLSLFLFIIIMDVITQGISEETPWAMLFADDFFVCDESGDTIAGRLERWRKSLEDAGLKLSRTKTAFITNKWPRRNKIEELL